MKRILAGAAVLFSALQCPAQEIMSKKFFSGKYGEKEADSSKATRMETVVLNADGSLTRERTALPGRIVLLSETRRGAEPVGHWVYRDKKGNITDSLDYDFSLARLGDSGVEDPGARGACDTTKSNAGNNADPLRMADGKTLIEYLGNALRYPDEAREAGIEGRVVIGGVLNEEGRLEDLMVARPAHPALDKEAARVVRSARFMKPLSTDGKPTRRCVKIPMKFALE